MEVINTIGRRKAAIARVYVSEGKGQIIVNGRDFKDYFPDKQLHYVVERKKPGQPKARKRFQFSKR